MIGRCCKPPIPARPCARLLVEREPVYAQADLTVQSREVAHDAIVADIMTRTCLVAEGGGTGRAKGRSMTAPLRNDPATVKVALGDRSYDIVIGRGLMASLGARIAALRPGAKAAIVTDENVARHHLPAVEAALAEAGVPTSRVIVPVGRARKALAYSNKSARRSSQRASSAAIWLSRSAAA